MVRLEGRAPGRPATLASAHYVISAARRRGRSAGAVQPLLAVHRAGTRKGSFGAGRGAQGGRIGQRGA